MNKNKNSWSLGNFIAVIILGGLLIIGGSLLGNYVNKKQAQQAVAGTQSFAQPTVEKTISYDGQDGKTALDLLKAGHQIESQDSSMGVYVSSIDGLKNTDTKFWMLYVDNQLATQSADKTITANGQKIEWRYESF